MENAVLYCFSEDFWSMNKLFRLNFLKIYALTEEAVNEMRFFCLKYFKGFFKVYDTCTPLSW